MHKRCWPLMQLNMLPEAGWHVSWSRLGQYRKEIDLSPPIGLRIALMCCIWWVIAPSLCSEARRELVFLDAKQAVSSTFAHFCQAFFIKGQSATLPFNMAASLQSGKSDQ